MEVTALEVLEGVLEMVEPLDTVQPDTTKMERVGGKVTIELEAQAALEVAVLAEAAEREVPEVMEAPEVQEEREILV